MDKITKEEAYPCCCDFIGDTMCPACGGIYNMDLKAKEKGEGVKYFTVKATGNTYPVKDDLQSWAFFWKPEEKAWVRECCDGDMERRLFENKVKGKAGLINWPGVVLTFIEEPRPKRDDRNEG